jgi:hypothetical protein
MLRVFADPNTDVVFKRIFGSEARKPLLNDLLERTGAHRIRSVQHFSLEQRVTAPKSKPTEGSSPTRIAGPPGTGKLPVARISA